LLLSPIDSKTTRLIGFSGSPDLLEQVCLPIPIAYRNDCRLAGKSTVSKTFATEANGIGAKVVSFFIARDVAERNRAANIIHSLAYRLATLVPAARLAILAALKEDECLVGSVLERRVQKLIIDPMQALPAQHPLIIFVVDALDECNDSDRQFMQQALVVLLRGICALPSSAHVKLFITSRMDDWINRTFSNALPEAHQKAQNVRLHELAQAEVESDIGMYFDDTFARIQRDHPEGRSLKDWPTVDEKERLVRKTGVLFVFASTVSRFLSHDGLSPRTKLNAVLREDTNRATTDPYKDLDDLYLQVLSSSLGGYSHASVIQRIVATVVLAAAPLTIEALSDIAGQDAYAVVRSLSSVLLVPEQSFAPQEPVRAFHPSLHDFLTNKNRCTDDRFAVDAATEHGRLAARCFEQMHKGLKKDVCNIRNPLLLNSEVPDLSDRITDHLRVTVRYACLYWHFHLGLAFNPDPALVALFTSFCKERLLFSIEAASLLGEVGSTYNGLATLQRCRPVRYERSLQCRPAYRRVRPTPTVSQQSL
jgi:hypothetical protein